MRVAISLRLAKTTGRQASAYVTEAERLGVDASGPRRRGATTRVTPLAFMAARTSRIRLGTGIMQAGTRTPALLAMTAMSLQRRCPTAASCSGLGVSGPQVIEGWHGIRFDRPVQRMRETVEIVRRAVKGERLEYKGQVYELPLPGGEGKALRSAAPPQPSIPIYLATLSPKSLEMTGEIADGWLGTSFMPEHARVFFDSPRAAGAARAGRSLAQLDLQAGGVVAFGDDVERLIPPRKPGLAFTPGRDGLAPAQLLQRRLSTRRLRRRGHRGAAPLARRPARGGDGPRARRAGAQDQPARHRRHGARAARGLPRAGITTLRVEPGGEGLAARLATLGRLLDLVRALR